MSAIDSVVIIGRFEEVEPLHGITHNEAWGIIAIATFIGGLLCIQSGELYPLALPVAAVVALGAAAQISLRQTEKHQQDSDDSQPGP